MQDVQNKTSRVNARSSDLQIQLEETVEQRRALTNRTFRLCNDGLRDAPTKKKVSARTQSPYERVDAPFTKEMATDRRCHVLTGIPETDPAVQAVCHAARPRRGCILSRARHACLVRARPLHAKRFERRRGRQSERRAARRGGTRTRGYQDRSVFSDIVGYTVGRNKHDRLARRRRWRGACAVSVVNRPNI